MESFNGTYLKSFCLETSAIGFKHTVNRKNKWQPLFWIFVLTLSFAAGSFHCCTLVTSYFKYPTMEELAYKNDANSFSFSNCLQQ